MPDVDVMPTPELVRELLREQFPDLADRPLGERLGGWDNVTYRLGDDLAVRLPVRQIAVQLLEHEQQWLPTLAIRLPIPVPEHVRVGRPGLGYPWPWSVVRWLQGESALVTPPVDEVKSAMLLAAFFAALHRVAPADAPVNPYRGHPLAERDGKTRERLGLAAADADAVERVWSDALAAAPYDGEPRWIHGDLHAGNILVRRGRICSIIDFGDLTSGDPATDLISVWSVLGPTGRAELRAVTHFDDDAWLRGRGWAISVGLAILEGDETPAMKEMAQRMIAAATTG